MTQVPDLGERLTAWVRVQLPDAQDVRIEGLERVEFGHSAEMMVFTIVSLTAGKEDSQDVVVRLRPPPPALLEPYDLKRQFDVLRALEGTEVRVPPVLWMEHSGEILGREFFVMKRVAGSVYEMETPSGADGSPECVRSMCLSMADQLAAIHNVDLSTTGLNAFGDGRDHLEAELEHWASEMHRVQRGTLPALERLLKALRVDKPSASPRATLVHGDAKPGNFAFVKGEVSAVFDWELTTIGDPLTDIGWMELLWMQPVGITSHPAAPSIDEWIARYEAVSGIPVVNRPWYRAFNAFKMAVICLVGGMLFDAGLSDDLKLVVAAGGVEILPLIGLADLGINEQLETGPIAIREERILEVQSRSAAAH
jgi:aminoglycoside phosphotransferase (APT) family kinase protein